MTTSVVPTDAATSRRSSMSRGLRWALASAAAFGLSGSLARSLIDLGWSPAAIVSVRVGGAFAVLLIPCLMMLRRTGLPTGRQAGRMVAYGAVAVAGAQLCFFSAVQYLSVGVALLLEYLAPVLLIGWHWSRSRQRPPAAVFVGAGLSLLGLAFVLDLSGNLTISPIGVLWGLGAALCLCAYFILSEESGSGAAIPPLLLTTVGTGVGALLVLLAGLVGVVPLAARTGTTSLAGATLPWWVPLALLVLVAATFAYLSGIVAVRLLGSSVASFVSLAEVIFAVVFAIALLGQQPSFSQLIGGVLVLAGIATVQRQSRR